LAEAAALAAVSVFVLAEASMAFAHKKLLVYQETLLFVGWVATTLRPAIKKGNSSIADQINRAASSISLNIAEGVGRWQPADKRRFYQIARGSACECDAALDVIEASKLYDTDSPDWLEERARIAKISNWLLRLIESVEKRTGET
jgi:four helix bundle protein